MINLVVGHSSFYLRCGWIKKGVDLILKHPENNEAIFSKNTISTIDELGIGSVMVQSLKFWMHLLDILEKKENNYVLKREIKFILENDPYLQKKNVLWLLHTYIMEREDKNENPVLWNLFIKDKKNNLFSESTAIKTLIEYYKSINESISERSAKDSVNVFIKNYYEAKNMKLDPEDNMHSPFVKLNYLIQNESSVFYFRNIESYEIAEEIILYLLKRKLDSKYQISITDFYNYVDGIIKMKFSEFKKLITKLENREIIFIDRAAGLENINLIKKELTEKEIIELILERE